MRFFVPQPFRKEINSPSWVECKFFPLEGVERRSGDKGIKLDLFKAGEKSEYRERMEDYSETYDHTALSNAETFLNHKDCNVIGMEYTCCDLEDLFDYEEEDDYDWVVHQ